MYRIDIEPAKYSQGDKFFQEYYNGWFITLWHEKNSMVSDTIKFQEGSHINQFLMTLRPNFE